ncbi:DUF6879 family protein [Actinoplanes sp. NPDC026619]|uniref:DUF6879 family protein n=1 Tax=Actinoplanes sp. NPDC026619 TaxID=3155798 RepID=UPI003409DFF4
MEETTSFDYLMEHFRIAAFRLEVRKSYGVLSEDAAFQKFLDGGDPGIDWLSDWLDGARKKTSIGKRIERVRIIDEPPSDFLRFELSITPHNLEAGEDIRYLPRKAARELDIPSEDFWLFDATTVLILNFDDNDRFSGIEPVTEPVKVAPYVSARDTAWQHAFSFRSYLSKDS